MINRDLETEISEAASRIESRQREIESELRSLAKKIIGFTICAWIFAGIGMVVIVFASIYWYLRKNTETDLELNLLGDFLAGTVAPIWSFAGLFLIYIAFLGQKQQLLNQQLEIMYSQLALKYTRQELAGQKEEMKEQNKTLRQQKFENTFFQMLNLFNSIVNSFDIRNSDREVITAGRKCFKEFYKQFESDLLYEVNNGFSFEKENLRSATIEQSRDAYSNFYERQKADLSHYFTVIYRIYKFIDQSDFENKTHYAAIARAQLSSYEQILMFYNCLHIHGYEKFKPLIERYAVFKNLDKSLVFNPAHLDEYYEGAYGLMNE